MSESTFSVLGLRPFIPSGSDFSAALNFFADLGFQKLWEENGYAGLSMGSARFILQNYDNADFAANLMVRIDVSDLDAWWQEIGRKNLSAKFPGIKIKSPTDFPWGREANIIDLAGVCWHIGEM